MKKRLLSFSFFLSLIISNNVKSQIALAFNGTTNVVSTTGVPLMNNQSRTVDAWIKTTNTANVQMVIADWGAMNPLGSRFTLNVLNNKLRIEVGGTGITGTTNVTTGQWVHCTAVYESTITTGPNVFLYVNGSLDASGNFTGYSTLTTTNTTGFRMGMRVDGISAYVGAIDEVKVYDYARTQAQVAADTVESCVPQSGLVAYYRLNEGIPNGSNTGSITAIDYSGGGNNGTLTSFTLSGTTSNWVTGRVRSGAPQISAFPSANICTNGTASLSVNASNSYTWSTGNSTSTMIAVSPTATTVYSVVTSNSAGCFYTSYITVTVTNAAPVLTVSAGLNPLCYGATTSLTASGAVTYSWTGGITNGQNFSPVATTQYTLTGGNACGTVTSVQTITVVPVPVSVSASSTTICTGTTSTLSAQSAMPLYTWTPGPVYGQTVFLSPTVTTIYTVTASNGTCIGTNTLQINTNQAPSISVNNVLNTICEGQSVTLVASGAGTNGTYTWMPGGTQGASVNANPVASVAYTVSGTNSLGCTTNAQSAIIVLAAPPLTAGASSTLLCNGQTLTLSASGAATYTWSMGASGASTVVLPPAGFTMYSVTGTASGNTCTATQTVAVAVITPSVNYTASVTICNGQSATLTASGANTYSWNNVLAINGQQVVIPIINSIFTLTAKTQSLNVSCYSTHLSTVVVNANPTLIVVASISMTMCKSMSNTLTASGAATYTWTNLNSFSPQVIVTPTATTTYTVFGQSAEGCESTAQVQIKITNCSGLEENAVFNSVDIFPNPANGTLFIRSEIDQQFKLYNLNGVMVQALMIITGQNVFDLKDMPTGIYFLRAEENAVVKKIVIE